MSQRFMILKMYKFVQRALKRQHKKEVSLYLVLCCDDFISPSTLDLFKVFNYTKDSKEQTKSFSLI